MGKGLNPSELVEGHRYSGVFYRELLNMLKHYGFERTNHGDAKHMLFKHPEFTDIPPVSIPMGKGEAKHITVEVAARACLEVELRRESAPAETLDIIPDWVRLGIGPHAMNEQADNALHFDFQHGANTNIPLRRYRMEYRGQELRIVSLDMPQTHTHLTQRDGSRQRAATVTTAIERLDEFVRVEAVKSHEIYDTLLQRLVEGYGFEMTNEAGQLTFDHPVYDLSLTVDDVADRAVIPSTTIDALSELKHQAEARYDEQLNQRMVWQDEGWQNDHQLVDGQRMPVMEFRHADGRKFDVPTHGFMGFYRPQDVAAAMDSLNLPAIEGVQVTDQPSPSPVIDTQDVRAEPAIRKSTLDGRCVLSVRSATGAAK